MLKHLKTYENFKEQEVLFVIDVQKSFSKFFNDKYLKELSKYCSNFKSVYQIWDNHHEGSQVDKDYLYDIEPEDTQSDDLYIFPNQIDMIEKRYNYDVDVEFYKNILDEETYNKMIRLEKENKLKVGDKFKTKYNTYVVYINNNHVWFHCGKKLVELFKDLKDKEVIFVGGAIDECVKDVVVAAKSFGVNAKLNRRYSYTGSWHNFKK